MGKYDDIDRHLITHCDELFPFASMDKPRDWLVFGNGRPSWELKFSWNKNK